MVRKDRYARTESNSVRVTSDIQFSAHRLLECYDSPPQVGLDRIRDNHDETVAADSREKLVLRREL